MSIISITMSVSQAAAAVHTAAEEESIDAHASIKVWQSIGQKLAKSAVWAIAPAVKAAAGARAAAKEAKEPADAHTSIKVWQGIGQKLAKSVIWAVEESDSEAESTEVTSVCHARKHCESDSASVDDSSEWEVESLVNARSTKSESVVGSTSAGEMTDSEADTLSAPASPPQTPLQIPRIPDTSVEDDLSDEPDVPEMMDGLRMLPAGMFENVNASPQEPEEAEQAEHAEEPEELNVAAWQDVCQRLASADFWDSVSDSESERSSAENSDFAEDEGC